MRVIFNYKSIRALAQLQINRARHPDKYYGRITLLVLFELYVSEGIRLNNECNF